ncbi:hypothetical protein CMI37_04525 [Candidatus Pacearchaeota archaeon]|nr:hypothetical protein [Candidatus Pacearchaeota archaeon]|tara:strand:- start:885 stop:1190 length:306 start_codon:yes stop_codon:yes gene_type:complete
MREGFEYQEGCKVELRLECKVVVFAEKLDGIEGEIGSAVRALDRGKLRALPFEFTLMEVESAQLVKVRIEKPDAPRSARSGSRLRVIREPRKPRAPKYTLA